MINDLKGKVVLVTGASRGLGKGIAKVLIEAGATVYITGRLHSEPNQFPSVIQTAEELNSLNLGKCVGLYCDHRIEEENEIVFNKIEENHENIDILVNNSFGWFHAKDDFFKNTFWGKDYARKWENTINIGFRLRESHSLKSCYAVSCNALKCSNIQKSLLIFNISSINSYISFFNPAFVFGKEGTDCLTFDMHERLQPFNVNVISLWPGLVRTEIMEKARETVDFIKNIWHASESIYLTGRAILALSTDPNVATKSGKSYLVADLAHEYGFTDIDKKYPMSIFSVRFAASSKYPRLTNYIPHFLKVPRVFARYSY